MGTNSIYRHPQYPRHGGEVVLKEKHLQYFYALRYAIERLRQTLNKDSADFQSILTLAGMSGVTVSNAMGEWDDRVYDELIVCATACAQNGMRFADFEEHLIGDYGFTIAVEVEDDEDDDE